MSGHSKWSTIKRQKGANDAKRGALFTKVGKEIAIAARQGGPDPEANYRLRLAVDKARSVNMPTDNIKRAIERATGGDKADEYEEIAYEGYGPGGVAILVETATDNRNRTAAGIRSIFAKSGGELAGAGSVAWQFEQRGVVNVVRDGGDPDEIALLSIDAGAVDVDTDADPLEIVTEPTDLKAVSDALESAGVKVESAEMTMLATMPVEVDVSKARANLRLIEALEDEDDVQRVTANFDLPDEILEEAAAFVIVLGIDPGTARTGYGIISRDGSVLRAIDHGCYETVNDRPLPQRLTLIHQAVTELIEEHRPEAVGVERLFFNKNVQTAFAVGQARGVVLLAAAQHGLPIAEYGPHEVKMAVTGYGRAPKDQVQRMVQMVLGLDALPRPDDAADALAVAICLAHSGLREPVAST